MSPYILPVCGLPRGKADWRNRKRGRYTGSYTPSIRGLPDLYHAVKHALGAIITELGVYASIYTPSYRPIRIIYTDVMWYKI